MKPVFVFEFKKDGFRAGEYSVYERSYRDGKYSGETYLFGVSKKYEAETICRVLNDRRAK